MLNWLTRRTDHSRTAAGMYDLIVASARQPDFYARLGVPDTREGRFEMLALHVALTMHRLTQIAPMGENVARTLAETFITDMDDNMREIGVGDLAVPKKIKRAAAALYDRYRDYGAALGAGAEGGQLAEVIAAAFGSADGGGATAHGSLDTRSLAHYMQRLAGGLAVTPDADVLAAKLPLPWPPQ